jgi:hypothetical protein
MDEEKPQLDEPVNMPTSKDQGCLHNGHRKMQGCLESVFRSYAKVVVRLPWAFIIAGILLAALASLGLLLGRIEDRPRDVWVPEGSPSVRNRDDVEDLWGEGDVIRYTVYVTAYDDDKPDIISHKTMMSIVDFDTRFKAIEEKGLKYSNICDRLSPYYRCQMYSSPLAFWERDDGTYFVDATTPY